MKKKIRVLIIFIALLLGIYALTTFALNKFLSGSRLKAMLIEPIEKTLGRNVEVDFIKVFIFKGISIKNVAVKDSSDKSNLASIESFKLSYDLWSLFQGKLVVTSIEIESPTINIRKDNQGVFNIATLGQARPVKEKEPNYEEEPVKPLPLEVSFDNITINKAELSLTDMTEELPNLKAESNASLSLKLGRIFADTMINGSVNIQVNGDYKGKKPVLILKGNFNQQQFSFQGSLSMEFDKFILSGHVDNFLTTPEVYFNVNSPRINLDNLVALADAGKTPIKKSQGEPERKQPQEPETEAPILPEQPATSETSPVETEVAFLNPEKAEETRPATKLMTVSYIGEVSISELVSKDFKANDIKVSYELKDNTFQAKNLKASVFGGELTGNVTLDLNPEEPPINGEIRTSNLQISELLVKLGKSSESFSGALTTNLTFNGTGLTWATLQTTLNGAGDYTLEDGGINSPVTSALAQLLDIPEIQDLRYEDLSGTMKLENGNALLNVSLSGSQLNIKSEGMLGLNGTLDMPLTLHLSPEYSEKLAKKASFSKYLTDDEGRMSMNLHVVGTINDPKITIDQSQIIEKTKAVIVKKAEEELEKFISKELGPASEEGNIVKGLSEKFLNEMFRK